MSLRSKLSYLARWAIHAPRVGGKWARLAAREGIWNVGSAHSAKAGGLHLPEAALELAKPDAVAAMFLRKRLQVEDLYRRAGAQFIPDDDGFLCEVNGLRFHIREATDIGVLHEIFAERSYGMEAGVAPIVIDIGMNIGAASLFFAREFGCEVYGYELFPSTAEMARRNLELNPEYAGKIHLHAFGLGMRNEELELPSHPQYRPSNSLVQPVPFRGGGHEGVEVRDAAEVVSDVLAKRAGRPALLKLDAEGAEYEIIDRLHDAGLLSGIDLVQLEWHEREGKDPQMIRERLREAGFRWFERSHWEAPVGFISAWRGRKEVEKVGSSAS